MKKEADYFLQLALQTYKSRKEIYGDSYIRHGNVLAAMFPDGLMLRNESDFKRFSILNMKIAKLCRYTKDFYNPHQDSIHDDGVYSFVLEELDNEINEIQF